MERHRKLGMSLLHWMSRFSLPPFDVKKLLALSIWDVRSCLSTITIPCHFSIPSFSLLTCVLFSFPSGIIHSTRSITRTCVSCGTGTNTTWPSSKVACFSIITPNFACRRSGRWRRWLALRTGKQRMTLSQRPMEIRLHVRRTYLCVSFMLLCSFSE